MIKRSTIPRRTGSSVIRSVGTSSTELHTAGTIPCCARDEYARSFQSPTGLLSEFCHVAKCAWLTCAATRNALAATVKLGFKPVLEGKNEASTT